MKELVANIVDRFYNKLDEINDDSKFFIGIGDSYCFGEGSQSIDLWEKYNWDEWKLNTSEDGKKEALKNSFVNVICKKYLKDYIPLNLGMGGKGNRYSIRELITNPIITSHKKNEKIVVLMITSPFRIDFSNHITSVEIQDHTTTLFVTNSQNKNASYEFIERPNGEKICSDYFAYSELIFDLLVLGDWCELNNAKLILLNNFDLNITKDKLFDILTKHDKENKIMLEITSNLIDRLPFDSLIKPMGYECVSQMLMHLDERDDLVYNNRFDKFIYEKTSKNHYMSKCLHPTYKGHELLADIIHQKINSYQ